MLQLLIYGLICSWKLSNNDVTIDCIYSLWTVTQRPTVLCNVSCLYCLHSTVTFGHCCGEDNDLFTQSFLHFASLTALLCLLTMVTVHRKHNRSGFLTLSLYFSFRFLICKLILTCIYITVCTIYFALVPFIDYCVSIYMNLHFNILGYFAWAAKQALYCWCYNYGHGFLIWILRFIWFWIW